MASITDKISRVSTGAGRPNSAVVQATRTVGGTSLSCDDLTNWTTDDVSYLAVYTLDTAGKIVPGSQVDFKGIVTGNTINNLTVTGGTDRAINVGDIVIAVPTSQYAKDLGDALLATHNTDGTLKNKVATLAKINGGSTDGVLLTDASGNVTGGKVTADKLDFTTLNFGNYSTTEVDTGFKWVDGKTIYKKSVNMGGLTNSTTKTVAHGITGATRFVEVKGYAFNPSSVQTIPLPYTHPNSAFNVLADVLGSNARVITGTDMTGYSEAYINLFYVKS